jgi:hypothetical protein
MQTKWVHHIEVLGRGKQPGLISAPYVPAAERGGAAGGSLR